MTRGDTGSQGENSGVGKEWRGDGEAVVCLGSCGRMDNDTQNTLCSDLTVIYFKLCTFNSASCAYGNRNQSFLCCRVQRMKCHY